MVAQVSEDLENVRNKLLRNVGNFTNIHGNIPEDSKSALTPLWEPQIPHNLFLVLIPESKRMAYFTWNKWFFEDVWKYVYDLTI
jgi:hypothetical protein